MQFGIDILLSQSTPWKQQKLALVTNDAATTISGEKSRAALMKNGFNINKLFAPEHGVAATGTDGAFQPNGTDSLTGLSIISLYGDKMLPDSEALNDVDAVIFDIPDIGCRFYTYLWTMTYVMEACARYQKPFIVLDRPNPIGASLEKTEGPMLDEVHCSSFIGRWNIPLKHSCTLGELANYFAATRITNLQLQIIEVADYQRQQTAGKDFPFVPTSPAIRDAATAMLYPGMGLLEGVNVSEGRGTTSPFNICGAPWINADELQHALQKMPIPGVSVSAIRYQPNSGLYANEVCHGVRWQLKNSSVFYPVHTGLTLLQTLHKMYPQHLEERLYKTVANPAGTGHLDKLLGVHKAFIQMQQQIPFAVDVAKGWEERIYNYLLY
jgi:uncharacterized protein YbbC (DUF1343 family)